MPFASVLHPYFRRLRPSRGPGFVLAALLLAFSAGGATEKEAPSAREVRSFQIQWQSALLDVRAGRFSQAAQTLEALKITDSLTRVYRASFLAETYLAAGQRKAAAQVLDAVLRGKDSPRETVWLRHLYRLRLQTYDAYAPAGERRELLQAALKAPLDDLTKSNVLYRLLALDSATVGARERRDYLRQVLAIGFANSRLDSAYDRLALAIPPEDTLWENQKLLLDFEEKLGLWQKAIDRASAMQARAPGSENQRNLRNKIALWYFNKGSYSESIKQYGLLRDRYGDTPDALLQTARAYRNLSQDSRSQQFYSRLLEQFPRDPKSAEVIWMRTFDAEAMGRMEDAIEGYTLLIESFPQHARAAEAMFRIGLTYYKRGDLDASLRAFRDLRAAQKTGRLAGAARYWEGKLLAKRGDAEAARVAWTDLAGAYPFGFYGHQARRELTQRKTWPDSLNWKRRFRDLRDGEVRAWMSGVMSGVREVPPGTNESPYLPVAKLVNMGMDSLVVLTLQSQVNAAPTNPWVLYVAARRCHEAGFDYEGYRFGVKLSERLPLEAWPSAPLSVLRLFYPPSYESLVRMEATRAGVSPWLVLSLIKQESGFEPRAVSRVGARGLMQMMPATGAIQAKKEKIEFHPDSLFVPRINTRLGIAYLRDLLRRYDGNPYYALAHYNAGPSALERWLPRLEDRPPEEGVEDIGYAETRDYVKRVMANYWTYQALWN